MKKEILYSLLGLCAVMGISGCKEDALTPSYEYRFDTFMPDPSAQDSTSILRREFYAKTGSYLFFNDTLQHNLLGYDYNGDPYYFTELIDISYNLGAHSAGEEYIYSFLNGLEEQKRALTFLENYILNHFTSELKPFSWLLVRTITGHVLGSDDRLTNLYAVYGQRCLAIACNQILNSDNEATWQAYAVRGVLPVMLSDMVAIHSDAFDGFRDVSSAYYGGTFTSTDDADNTHKLAEVGFLVRGKDSNGYLANGYYPTFEADLDSYVSFIVNYSVEQMETRYGDYPLVIEKFRLYREALTSLGYIF